MKKLLTLLALFNLANADLIPPNSKSVRETVILTNAPDFRDVSIFMCHRYVGNGELECKVLNSYNAQISKGYKFNSGPYLFAIKKSTIAKFGGINKFMQKPLKNALKYLVSKKGLGSTIGTSSTQYVASNSKAKNTTTKYKIVSIKGNSLELVRIK